MKKTARTLIFLLIAALLSCTNPVNNPAKFQLVSTFAGTGQEGVQNGAAGVAQFHNPFGVATDSSDNVYVADENNHMIRKITPQGVVSTYAGTGQAGHRDGAGVSAQFEFPAGVAVDSSGNVYVADSRNHRIRRITPGGEVSTFAGPAGADRLSGDRDATGNQARFYNPSGVATDSSGNVYVADYGNHMIRRITPERVVSTLAGSGKAGTTNGIGTQAQFDEPVGVAVFETDNNLIVYVADTNNHRIRKIAPQNDGTVMVSTFAGSGQPGTTNGIGTQAQFDEPVGVAVDSSGNVYVADSGSNRIRKIAPQNDGTVMVSTLAGTSAQFDNPSGVAVDSSGNVYVADYNNHRIRKIIPQNDGTVMVSAVAGTSAQFDNPNGVATDSSGNVVYVADSSNSRIRKIVYQ